MAQEQAIVAGGCFWCTEAVFNDVIGVSAVESGYIGGRVADPTYRQVCSGDDRPCRGDPGDLRPGVISYAEILDVPSALTIRPSSTARAMTSAPSIARRSFPLDGQEERRGAMERAQELAARVTTIEPPATGIRPRTITRIIGKAKASAIPIAWR